MRVVCGVLGLIAAGLLAGVALGVTVPTVPTPTVTVPKLPLPTPTVPTPTVTAPRVPVPPAPTPTVPAPAPAPAPAPKVPTPTVPSVPAPVPAPTPVKAPVASPPPKSVPAPVSSVGTGLVAGNVSRSSPAPVSTSSSSGALTAPSFRHAAAPHRAHRRSAHRAGLQLRRVVARFKLAHTARVRISVEQLAPVCRTLKSYTAKMDRGLHAFHFPAARITAIGTYRLTGALPHHKLFSVLARRLRHAVKRGGNANVCRSLLAHASAFSLETPGTLAGAAGSNRGTSASKPKGQLHVRSARGSRQAAPRLSSAPPARNPLVRAVSLTDAPSNLRPLLLGLLALAIVLLTLAAAPQRVLPSGRAAALVAERRMYFAAAGIWLLAVVAVVTSFA